MQHVNRDPETLKYTFDLNHSPVLTVDPGESFTLDTEDAPSGTYRTLEDAVKLLDAWYVSYSPPKANPVTGPVYVRGVEPGDTLVVQIEDLQVDAQAATYWRPGHKPLGDSIRWSELNRPTLVIGRVEGSSVIMDEAATFENGAVGRHRLGLQIRSSPFIGTIGVAPEREVETSVAGQGSWGGNLDSRHICAGTSVLIPCYNKGGLLYVGDVHASQGDTEFYGTAMETRGRVTIRCGVVKGRQVSFLRLVTSESIISLASARPLEEAVWRSSTQLMEWLVQEYGCSQVQAYLLLGVNPDFRINVYQMALMGKLQYTVGAELLKRSLPGLPE